MKPETRSLKSKEAKRSKRTLKIQPKPWLPKRLEKHRIITDIENAEMQPETWETRKQRQTWKHHEHKTKLNQVEKTNNKKFKLRPGAQKAQDKRRKGH